MNTACSRYGERIFWGSGYNYCPVCGDLIVEQPNVRQDPVQSPSRIIRGGRREGVYVLDVPEGEFNKDTDVYIVNAYFKTPFLLHVDEDDNCIHDIPSPEEMEGILNLYNNETAYLRQHYDHVEYGWKLLEWYTETGNE